jgi:hypothetical protein
MQINEDFQSSTQLHRQMDFQASIFGVSSSLNIEIFDLPKAIQERK